MSWNSWGRHTAAMSSLAAARADNFYYPPAWEPKRGGLNKFNNSNGALGKRANKLKSHGILIIRFELMYNSWCLGCGRAIGRGTRYNAEKKKAGMYFSTPIYEFTMKCATCPQKFVIRTDPEHRDYEFVSGIRRKVEGYNEDTAQAAGAMVVGEEDGRVLAQSGRVLANTKARRSVDAFASLEHAEEDKRKARTAAARLEQLEQLAATRSERAYELNKALRSTARAARQAEQSLQAEARARGLGIALLPEAASDQTAAEQHREAFHGALPASQVPGVQITAGQRRRQDVVVSRTCATVMCADTRRRLLTQNIFSGQPSPPPRAHRATAAARPRLEDKTPVGHGGGQSSPRTSKRSAACLAIVDARQSTAREKHPHRRSRSSTALVVHAKRRRTTAGGGRTGIVEAILDRARARQQAPRSTRPKPRCRKSNTKQRAMAAARKQVAVAAVRRAVAAQSR